MWLLDRHTGGQTNRHRKKLFLCTVMFCRQSNKVSLGNSFSILYTKKISPPVLFSPSDPKANLKLGLLNYISRVILENWWVGEFKTERICFRTLLGEKKTWRIQLCNIYTHYLNGVRKRCSFLDRNGSFSCEVRYLTPVVYSHFTMTIARVKRPYTI